MTPGVLVFQQAAFMMEAFLIAYTGCRLLGVAAGWRRLLGFALLGGLLGMGGRQVYAALQVPFGLHTLMGSILLILMARWALKLPWRSDVAAILFGSVLTMLGSFLTLLGVSTVGPDITWLSATPAGMVTWFLLEHLPLLAAALWLYRSGFVLMDLGNECYLTNRRALHLLLAILAQTYFLLYIAIYRFTSELPAFRDAYPSLVTDIVYWTAAILLPAIILLLLRELNRLVQSDRRVRDLEHQAMIGNMVAMVSHEVRNPLTAVYGFLQLLERVIKEAEAEGAPTVPVAMARMFCDGAMEPTRHVVGMLTDFLAIARPMGEEELEPLDLGQLVAEVVEQAGVRAAQVDVKMAIHAEPGLPPLTGSPQRLRQTVLNLVINAIQAVQDKPGERSVRVEVAQSDDQKQVVIRIRDTGVGIAAEDLQRIFQVFFTTKPTGTGLGLALVNQVVDDHGGTVDVRSTPGQGTEFILCLPFSPLARPEPDVAGVTAESAAESAIAEPPHG